MKTEIERRTVEIRADASTGVLTGILIPYERPTKIAGIFVETFRPGCMKWTSPLVNFQHDRTRPLARLHFGLELTDGPSALRAEVRLPDTQEGKDTATLVKAGILRGLSAEFRAYEEEWKNPDEREIIEAELLGLAIVDDPAHGTATIEEVRALTRYRNLRTRWF